MANVLLSIKTDAATKKAVKEFAGELGVSTTALINMVLKQTLRDKKIVLSTASEPTPYLEKIITMADVDYNEDKDITHTKGAKEALAHIDSLMNK